MSQKCARQRVALLPLPGHQKPPCIVRPKSVENVTEAVRIANEYGVPISVLGGGHRCARVASPPPLTAHARSTSPSHASLHITLGDLKALAGQPKYPGRP